MSEDISMKDIMRLSDDVDRLLRGITPHDRVIVLGAAITGLLSDMPAKERNMLIVVHLAAVRACAAFIEEHEQRETRH